MKHFIQIYLLKGKSNYEKILSLVLVFVILSYYGWLSNPVMRSIDGISVASDNITWNMSNSNELYRCNDNTIYRMGWCYNN